MKKEAFTTSQMIAALQKTKGMVYLAADELGCSYQTVYNYIARHPTVKTAWETEGGKILDVGEMKLYQSVLNGEAWGVCFLLKTKGKHRGYVERTEQTGKDGGALQVDVTVTSARSVIATRLATMAARKAEGTGTNGQRHDLPG